MNYHMIRTDDMLNGDGLRVVLFVSGCGHHCEGCHNPETWDCNSGKLFTNGVFWEIYEALDEPYISGLTLSGGDPLFSENQYMIYALIKKVKECFPDKTIWLYTGYTLSVNDFWRCNSMRSEILSECDVVVDGPFKKELADVNYPWAGSTNQRVIDVKKTIEAGEIVLYSQEK